MSLKVIGKAFWHSTCFYVGVDVFILGRQKMRLLRSAFAATGLAFSALCGASPTATVKFDDYIFNNTGYDIVTIAETNLPEAWVAAGRFQGTVTAYQGVEPSIFVNGLDDLFMYCYDIYEPIWGGRVVDYAINLTGPTARTRDVLGAVNWVLNGNSNFWADPYAWLHPKDSFQSAAIQLAIWESKYETSGWDLANGSFRANWLDDGTSAFWAQIVAAVNNGAVNDLAPSGVMTLEAAGAQDMITGDPPPVQVPLPGTLALLGAGLVGLGLARRRA